MKCLERSFHIAGTVNTNLTSLGLRENPRSPIVFRQWSFRYLMEREKTFIAGNTFPETSWILESFLMFFKRIQR